MVPIKHTLFVNIVYGCTLIATPMKRWKESESILSRRQGFMAPVQLCLPVPFFGLTIIVQTISDLGFLADEPNRWDELMSRADKPNRWAEPMSEDVENTLSPISLSGLSTVRYKTILNTGSVGWAGAAPPNYKLGKFFHDPWLQVCRLIAIFK